MELIPHLKPYEPVYQKIRNYVVPYYYYLLVKKRYYETGGRLALPYDTTENYESLWRTMECLKTYYSIPALLEEGFLSQNVSLIDLLPIVFLKLHDGQLLSICSTLNTPDSLLTALPPSVMIRPFATGEFKVEPSLGKSAPQFSPFCIHDPCLKKVIDCINKQLKTNSADKLYRIDVQMLSRKIRLKEVVIYNSTLGKA